MASVANSSAPIKIGPYLLDPNSHCLKREKSEIQLSPLASRFLQLLALSPGEVVSRNKIIDALWDGDYLTGDPALHRLVSEIRRALDDHPRAPRFVQTVHRRGYRLIVESSAMAEADREDTIDWRKWLLWAALFALIVGGAKVMIEELIVLRAVTRP